MATLSKVAKASLVIVTIMRRDEGGNIDSGHTRPRIICNKLLEELQELEFC